MFSTLQRRHSFSATRGASTLMGKEDEGNLTGSHKSRFHRQLKSSAPTIVSEEAEPSRARIMSLSGNEKRSKREGGGRSLMDLFKFKKRRKSLQESKHHKTKVCFSWLYAYCLF